MIADTIFFSAEVVLVYMIFWFVVAMIKKRNDVADIAWGLGFIVLTLSLLWLNPVTIRMLVISALVFLWGSRLAIHIYLRNRHKKEDFRYQKWREDWGKWFIPRTFLQVFLLQGFFLLLIATPIVITSASCCTGLNWLDAAGVLIWLVGFFFETIGDYQLSQFLKKKNHDEILTSGLWQYTRHPNYFGEVMQWWGVFLVGLSASYGWYGLIGPLTITFLILKVSGIPMLEKKYKGNKKFEEYKKTTSAFFPWPPKK
ncbi:DUF1295 domain-containing protein [Candidatus Peregrinibacteria bacterium]|nr:DUF1295 domain-containing protein [Candidatus Peregrinibacteria bacterium]